MTTIAEALEEINAKLKYYSIETSNVAIGEDGNYLIGDDDGTPVGYSLINDETDVVEHTSMLLPAIIFQANHLDGMLDSLLNEKEDTAVAAAAPMDDVVLN